MIIGIDPGTETGIATIEDGELVSVKSISFWDAIEYLETWEPHIALVVVEDTRGLPIYERHRRRQMSRNAFSRLCRSVGAIDKECTLWEMWLSERDIPHLMAEPGKGKKWDARLFKRITGYEGRANQHGRDAARIAWGRNSPATN